MILVASIILALTLAGTPIFLMVNAIKENKEIKQAKLKQLGGTPLKSNTSVASQAPATV